MAMVGRPLCPFARTAQWEVVESIESAMVRLRQEPALDVAIVPVASLARPRLLYPAPGFIALLSDPQTPIIVRGTQSTQEIGVFYLVQREAELEEARRLLSHTPYYDQWADEDLKAIGIDPMEIRKVGNSDNH